MKKILPVAVMMAALFAAVPAYAAPDDATQAAFKTLIAAVAANDYDGFTSVCDDKMKAAITKQMLEGVSGQFAPRAKEGYDELYLGELNQQGYQVHLWRLRFKDGKDDVLATLSMKDGKVGGFYLR